MTDTKRPSPLLKDKSKAEIDCGLQPERTLLSWQRSLGSYLLTAMLLLRSAIKQESFLLVILFSVMLLLTIFLYSYLYFYKFQALQNWKQGQTQSVLNPISLWSKILIAGSIALCAVLVTGFWLYRAVRI